MDFHGIDLNLLAAFDALMRERNVTRAAKQLGVSQPATSAALSRLRKLLGDPLFIRSAEGLVPTPLARDLAEPISQALRQIESTLVRKAEFIPHGASLTFNVGFQDYPAFVLLPSLLQAIRHDAPGVSINVHAFNDRDHSAELLHSGEIDVAVGVPPTHADSRILTRPILRDEFVTIIASGHPAARGSMSLKTYLELEHVLVSPEGEQYGIVDQVLAQQGKKRTLVLSLPQMFAAPAVVSLSTMTSTILRRVALISMASGQLVFFPPPLPLPSIVFDLIWHRRSDGSASQQWLRGLIESTAAAL